jgi:hypothetical protein
LSACVYMPTSLALIEIKHITKNMYYKLLL